VPDPRGQRNKKHNAAEILTCLIMGYVVGNNSLRTCMIWAKYNVSWLRAHTGMKLRNGIASISTVSRLLAGIDEIEFLSVFVEWVTEIVSPQHNQEISKGGHPHIAIDGKALKGSQTHETEHVKAPMVLNAIDVSSGLILAQYPIRDKGCELKELQNIMALLRMGGCLLTIDAAGTYTEIMEAVINAGAHFLLQVKGNQKNAREEITSTIEDFELNEEAKSEEETYGRFDSSERNRERNEYRSIRSCQNLALTPVVAEQWPWVKALVEQVRILHTKDADGKDTTPGKEEFLANGTWRQPAEGPSDSKEASDQKVGLVTDLSMNAKEMLLRKRNHWVIENHYHHVINAIKLE